MGHDSFPIFSRLLSFRLVSIVGLNVKFSSGAVAVENDDCRKPSAGTPG